MGGPTGAKKAHIETGLRVSGSESAAKAGERWEFLTLDQVGAVAKFDTDPDVVKAIVAAAKSGRFDHTLQRLRDDRAEADAQAAVRVQLTDAGVVVIERDEVVWPVVRLDNHGIDSADHGACAGHAAYIGYAWTETGVAGGKKPMSEQEVRRVNPGSAWPSRSLTVLMDSPPSSRTLA